MIESSERKARPGPDDSPALSGWAIFGLFVLAFVYVQTVAGVVQSFVGHIQTVALATQLFGIFGAVVLYSETRGARRADWPDLDRLGMTAGQVAAAVAAVTCLGLAANAVMALETELVPYLREWAELYEAHFNALLFEASGVDRILGLLAVCVGAPLTEEALFRGTFLPEQIRSSGTTVAVVTNGAMFAAFHGNPVSFLPLIVIGILLAQIVAWSGSLWSGVLLHAVLNVFNGLVFPELIVRPGPSELGPLDLSVFGATVTLSPLLQLVAAIVVFGLVGAGLWWWLARSYRPTPNRQGATH